MNSKLYLALGQERQATYLVSYDLVSGQCRVLASSRRAHGQFALDNGTPFRAQCILADPQRDRILFLTATPYPRSGANNGLNGIWAWNVKKHQFKQVLKCNWGGNSHLWVSQIGKQRALIQVDNDVNGDAFIYDLSSNRAQMIYVRSRGLRPVNAKGPKTDPAWLKQWQGWPRLLRNGVLWSIQMRVDLKTGRLQMLPKINDKRPLRRPRGASLEFLPSGRVLYGRPDGVWILTPPPMP